MKRQLIQMDDPVFAPSVTKTAHIPVNVAPAGLACSLELYLGASEGDKQASSGIVSFTSAGGQTVDATVTMPATVGISLHVYVDVYVESQYLAGYQGTEDVIIPSVSVGPIDWT